MEGEGAVAAAGLPTVPRHLRTNRGYNIIVLCAYALVPTVSTRGGESLRLSGSGSGIVAYVGPLSASLSPPPRRPARKSEGKDPIPRVTATSALTPRQWVMAAVSGAGRGRVSSSDTAPFTGPSCVVTGCGGGGGGGADRFKQRTVIGG